METGFLKIKHCILVVDDDDLFRSSMADMIQRGGFQVVQASQAEEALEVLQNTKVDIVVSDIQMGATSGMDLLHKIQADMKPAPDVFLMTGFSGYCKEDVLKAGGVGLIRKPDDLKNLVTILEEQLAKTQSHSQ